MRYGIFADVHSNLEAFEAVLEALKKEAIDKYMFAGDIVGYGADYGECIKLLEALGAIMVCGNHDWASAGLFDIKWFNNNALKAVEWTSQKLTEDQRQFLKSMPLTRQEGDITLVHGSLDSPGDFKYIFYPDEAQRCLLQCKTAICVVGHTHSTAVFYLEGSSIKEVSAAELWIEKGISYLINVGSVGQPRDWNPQAAYAVYDTEKRLFKIKRVAYDVSSAQKKIINAGLPQELALRLMLGE